MKRLIDAIVELREARAELLREEAAMLHLGKWAEGYEAGKEDAMYCGADCECDTEADNG